MRGVAPARVADRSGIASAASHVGAPRYDARDDRVRKDWQRVEAEANEAYLRGYVTKDIDEEAAREAFRTVLAALPATHPTAVKAQRWLLRLDGKVAEED